MDANKLGQIIKDYRKANGLTQKQFADLLYVSDKSVSRWETGNGFPDIGVLPQLSSLLGVPIDVLMAAANEHNEICAEKDFNGALSETDNCGSGSESCGKTKKRSRSMRIFLIAVSAFVAVCIGVTVFLLVVKADKPKKRIFEAEFAEFTGEYRIERTEKASGGACAAYLREAESQVIFNIVSDADADATVGIMVNRPVPVVFESYMTFSLNGNSVEIGNVPGMGMTSGPTDWFYAFEEEICVNVNLSRGDNVFAFTVKEGNAFNMDYISINTSADVEWKKPPYVYEAEDARINGVYSIDKTSRASGGKCIGALKRQGDSIVFDVESREDREAEMQIFINRPEDYVFEDKFILRVNGNPITVGNVEGTGNDGTFEGIYFSFFVPVKVSVPLVRGANTIEFVAVEGENLDCLVIR